MQPPSAPSRRPRIAARAGSIVALAALGFAVAAGGQRAAALDLPTITLPGVTTITLPAALTSTTTGTTATTATTTTATTPTTATTTAATAGPAPSPPASPPDPGTETISAPRPSGGPAADSTIAGAIHLAGGVVSIPISSVRAPAHLQILLSYAPHVAHLGRPIAVRGRIVDTRGYVIRGARVRVSSGPVGKLRAAGTRISAADGLVGFTVPTRALLGRTPPLVLLVRAGDPSAPGAADASRRVLVPSRRPR